MRKQIRYFYTERQLESAILSFIHSHIENKEMEKNLLEIYEELDLNNDGKLNYT